VGYGDEIRSEVRSHQSAKPSALGAREGVVDRRDAVLNVPDCIATGC
jgi:hypothetical protein